MSQDFRQVRKKNVHDYLADDQCRQQAISEGIQAFLEKRFSPLQHAVNECISLVGHSLRRSGLPAIEEDELPGVRQCIREKLAKHLLESQ